MENEKKMSEFCEKLMSVTEGLKPGPDDCALVMCSDKRSMACRVAGNIYKMSTLILKKMHEDANFAECILLTCSTFSLQLLRETRKDEDAKLVSMDMEPEKNDGNAQV